MVELLATAMCPRTSPLYKNLNIIVEITVMTTPMRVPILKQQMLNVVVGIRVVMIPYTTPGTALP